MPLDTLGNGPTVLTSPHLVTQKLLVDERSIGNRMSTTWTASQNSKYYIEALSAFGYFGERSYSLYKSPPGYSKTFWLMRGPLGIGSGYRKSKFKVLPRGFKCLWILWGTVLQSLQVPTWLLKNFWLMRGPSGIGSGCRKSRFKVLHRGFKCLWILWGSGFGPYRSPPGYSKTFG